MAVDYCFHIRSKLVDFTMDESLNHAAAILLIDRIGIEVVLHDVARGHRDRCERAGHQVTAWIARMTNAHMSLGIEHTLLGENAVGGNKVLYESRVHRAAGSRWRLRTGRMLRGNDQY